VLDAHEWLTPLLGRFTLEQETRYPLYRSLDGSQFRSGRVGKISSPTGFDTRTVQPVASRYTDFFLPYFFINFSAIGTHQREYQLLNTDLYARGIILY
jgi:hypothetical protein